MGWSLFCQKTAGLWSCIQQRWLAMGCGFGLWCSAIFPCVQPGIANREVWSGTKVYPQVGARSWHSRL